MKLARAILSGILLWVLIFFEVSLFKFGLDLEGGIYYSVHYFSLILLVLICSFVYFKNAEANLREGFFLGIIFLISGTILDLIITIPFWSSFSEFYNVYLFVGILETFVLTIVFGLFFEKINFNKKKNSSFYQSSLADLKRQVTKSPENLRYRNSEAEIPARVSKVVMSVAKKKKKR